MTKLQQLYHDAVLSDCDTSLTVAMLAETFPSTGIITLTKMADALYDSRRIFLQSLDRKIASGITSQPKGKVVCLRCHDPYCSRALLVPNFFHAQGVM